VILLHSHAIELEAAVECVVSDIRSVELEDGLLDSSPSLTLCIGLRHDSGGRWLIELLLNELHGVGGEELLSERDPESLTDLLELTHVIEIEKPLIGTQSIRSTDFGIESLEAECSHRTLFCE
jgi:hypothetical protein